MRKNMFLYNLSYLLDIVVIILFHRYLHNLHHLKSSDDHNLITNVRIFTIPFEFR